MREFGNNSLEMFVSYIGRNSSKQVEHVPSWNDRFIGCNPLAHRRWYVRVYHTRLGDTVVRVIISLVGV